MSAPDTLILALAAIGIEALAGYPPAVFSRIGHPVTWIGTGINHLERRLNRPVLSAAQRRRRGIAALIVLIAASAGAALLIEAGLRMLLPGWAGLVLLACLASSFLAQRSLDQHVARVAAELERGLAGGREAVSQIVGRDPQSLDAAGVARAAIESLAENFSDGVVAPTLYLAAGGLAGGGFYKAVNTADSMIGHRTPRHEAFGWAAARLDDLVNLPASRLSAVLIIAAAALLPGYSGAGAAWATLRDARRHRSPNAGWPEAAMAGALGLRLAGPRTYNGQRVDDHWMGHGRVEADAGDIGRALRVYRTACLLQAVLMGGLLWAIAP